MPRPDRPRPPRWRSLAAALLAAAAIVPLGAGCQSSGNGVLTRWRMAYDSSLAKGVGKDFETSDDGRNLMARWLRPKAPKASDPNQPPALVLGPNGWNVAKVEPNPEAEAELKDAQTLFQQGKLDEAEAAYKQIAKTRKDTPWGEKAQFYLAETQFQRGKLTAAHDSFESLHAVYPGTQYLEKLVEREYQIAQTWLAMGDPKAKPEQKASWKDRFTGRRPLVDTNGHALAALEHVRHNDPMGPLADDAVMRIADFHYEHADYESAALFYDQLIDDPTHRKSPFLRQAQLSSIDAKIKGYLGPDYDGAGLDQAREMIKRHLAMFPESVAAGGNNLYHTLDLISDQQAERAYHVGDYYRRTGHVTSAEFYFAMVPSRWPNSPWAGKAKEQLAMLAKMPRKEALPSKILTPPGSADPMMGGGGGAAGAGGMAGMNMMGMGGMGPGAGMF